MKPILALTLALILSSAVFIAFPGLDLATSRLFYDGSGFPVATSRWAETVRRMLYSAEDLAFVATLILWLVLTLRRRPFLNLAPLAWLFQMLIFLLGPGLIVNGIIKPLWGRVRPFQTIPFGGTGEFTRAWEVNPLGAGSRSFVSGEMAGSVALAISLTMILRANRNRMAPTLYRLSFCGVFLIPLFTAWQRMAAGRHFLSDIVIAALIVGLLAAALQHYMQRQKSW